MNFVKLKTESEVKRKQFVIKRELSLKNFFYENLSNHALEQAHFLNKTIKMALLIFVKKKTFNFFVTF